MNVLEMKKLWKDCNTCKKKIKFKCLDVIFQWVRIFAEVLKVKAINERKFSDYIICSSAGFFQEEQSKYPKFLLILNRVL